VQPPLFVGEHLGWDAVGDPVDPGVDARTERLTRRLKLGEGVVGRQQVGVFGDQVRLGDLDRRLATALARRVARLTRVKAAAFERLLADPPSPVHAILLEGTSFRTVDSDLHVAADVDAEATEPAPELASLSESDVEIQLAETLRACGNAVRRPFSYT
jgi:hypothetical protein